MNTKCHVFLVFLLYWIQNSLAHSYENLTPKYLDFEYSAFFLKCNIILGRCSRMQGGGLWGHVEGEEHNPLRVTYICFSSLLLFCMLVAQFSTLVCCPSKCTEVQHSKSPSTSHFPFWRAAVSQSLSLY